MSAFQRPLTISSVQLRPGRAVLAPLRAQRFELDPVPSSRARIRIEVPDGKSPLFVNVLVDDAQGTRRKRSSDTAAVQQSVNAGYEASRTRDVPRRGLDYARTVELVERLQDSPVDEGQQHCLNTRTQALLKAVLKAIGNDLVRLAVHELLGVAAEYAELNKISEMGKMGKNAEKPTNARHLFV